MTNLTLSHPTYPVPCTLKTLPLSRVIPHLLNLQSHSSPSPFSSETLSLTRIYIFLYLCSENLIMTKFNTHSCMLLIPLQTTVVFHLSLCSNGFTPMISQFKRYCTCSWPAEVAIAWHHHGLYNSNTRHDYALVGGAPEGCKYDILPLSWIMPGTRLSLCTPTVLLEYIKFEAWLGCIDWYCRLLVPLSACKLHACTESAG